MLAGLLIAVGILIRGPPDALQNPAADPTGFVQLATSTAFTVRMLTTLGSIPLRMFGFLALYSLLKNGQHERTALAALVLALTGMALFAHVPGLAHLSWPAVGELYLAGHEAVIQLAGFSSYSMAFFGAAILLGLLALISYGVAMWWYEPIPSGAMVVSVLQVIPLHHGGVLGYQFESFGGFMLALRGAWILLAIRA